MGVTDRFDAPPSAARPALRCFMEKVPASAWLAGRYRLPAEIQQQLKREIERYRDVVRQVAVD